MSTACARRVHGGLQTHPVLILQDYNVKEGLNIQVGKNLIWGFSSFKKFKNSFL